VSELIIHPVEKIFSRTGEKEAFAPLAAGNFDIAADGRSRMLLGDQSTVTTSVKVVLNWFEDLNQTVPPRQ